jgi:hypothetical protein
LAAAGPPRSAQRLVALRFIGRGTAACIAHELDPRRVSCVHSSTVHWTGENSACELLAAVTKLEMPPIAIQKGKHVTREPRKLKIVAVMNRSQIEAAVERNLPFALRMADGKVYAVPHRDYIFLPPKAAFVVQHFENISRFVKSKPAKDRLVFFRG